MQTGIVRIPFRFRLTRYRASSSRPLIGHFNKPRVNEWKLFWKRRDIGGRIGKRKEKRKKKTRPKEKVVSLVPSSCREACLPDRAPLMECQPPVVENFFLHRKRKPPPSLLRAASCSKNNYGKFCHDETKYFARMRRLGAARLAYRGSIKCLSERERGSS